MLAMIVEDGIGGVKKDAAKAARLWELHRAHVTDESNLNSKVRAEPWQWPWTLRFPVTRAADNHRPTKTTYDKLSLRQHCEKAKKSWHSWWILGALTKMCCGRARR